MKLIAKITIFFMLSTPILALASNYMEDHAAKSAPLSMVLHSDDGYHHHGDGIWHHHGGDDAHDHDGLSMHHTNVVVYALLTLHYMNTLISTNAHTHYFTPLYQNKVPDFPDRPPIA